jgi:glycerate kinase
LQQIASFQFQVNGPAFTPDLVAFRVLVVPDKFKGTLTARQAAMAIARGWLQARPDDVLETLPMADGGDGFGEVLGQLLNAQPRTCATVDAAGRSRVAAWWFEPETRTAVIETAEVNGLALFPRGQFHPFELDTFGVGALLREAVRAGAKRVYAGVGGSATNDGGFGLARALGYRFRDAGETELRAWTELERLARVDEPVQALDVEALTVAVDVENPLLGPEGATLVYGPQKGLLISDLPKAEACLTRLAEVMNVARGDDLARQPASGAAGGLGFGLRAFCGGDYRSGGEIFATLSRLDERILAADLVITAEGRFDEQTLMGKGVGVVAEAAARAEKPCYCLAGAVGVDAARVSWPRFRAFAIVPELAELSEATAHADECLSRLAAHVAAVHNLGLRA